LILHDMVFRPVLDHQNARQHHGSPIEAASHTLDLQAKGFVFQYWLPLVSEHQLHHAFRAALVFNHGDAVVGGRQDAQREHALHGVNDRVVLVHQDVCVVEAVFTGNPPVAVTGTVHAADLGVFVHDARRGRPQRMRELVAVLREAERQIVGQRRNILVREVVFTHEDEEHAVDFMYRVRGDTGGSDQLVVRVGDDGYQLAALQVESEAVVPAGDGALVEAHGLLGQPHATV